VRKPGLGVWHRGWGGLGRGGGRDEVQGDLTAHNYHRPRQFKRRQDAYPSLYACMCVRMLGYLFALLYIHVTHTQTHTHTYTHAYTHSHTQSHTHTHTHTVTHTHIYTHTHTHTSTHTHISFGFVGVCVCFWVYVLLCVCHTSGLLCRPVYLSVYM